MAESLVSFITKNLRDGYHLEKISGSSAGGGLYQLIDPKGEVVYNNNLAVRVHDRQANRNSTMSILRRVGALKPPTRSHTPGKEPPREAPVEKDKTTVRLEALEAARAALADKMAQPRERKIAREFLLMFNDQERLMELTRQAMTRLKQRDQA